MTPEEMVARLGLPLAAEDEPEPEPKPQGPDVAAVSAPPSPSSPPAEPEALPEALPSPYREALEQLREPIPAAWVDPRTPPPDREQLLITDTGEDFLPRGIVALLISAGGIGKTQAICQLAVAVAAGRPWLATFHPRKRSGRVLLLLGEEDRLEVHRRLARAFGALGLSDAEREAARLNIHAEGFAGLDVALIGSEGRFDPPVTTAIADALLEQIRALGEWDLVVFDPASRWNGTLDENGNRQGTLFVQVLERFAALPGRPAVLVAAHTPKSERGGKSPPKTPRGASAVFDGARFVVALAEDADGAVVLSVEKSNYTRRPEPIRLLRGAGGLFSYGGPVPAKTCKARAGEDLAERILAHLRANPDACPTGSGLRAALGNPGGTALANAISLLGGKIETRRGPRGSTIYHARPLASAKGGQGDFDY